MNSESERKSGLEAVGSTWQLLSRMQAEGMALMGRRMRAYAALPTTLANCHASDDYLTQQLIFWQIAQRQYLESFGRVISAVPRAVMVTPSDQSGSVAEGKAAVPRDYMVVSPPAVAAPKAPAAAKTVDEEAPVRVRRSA